MKINITYTLHKTGITARHTISKRTCWYKRNAQRSSCRLSKKKIIFASVVIERWYDKLALKINAHGTALLTTHRKQIYSCKVEKPDNVFVSSFIRGFPPGKEIVISSSWRIIISSSGDPYNSKTSSS